MTVLRQVQAMVDGSRATATVHPFFNRFAQQKEVDQIKRFAIEWYLAATGHKMAFPYLVAITRDDKTRQELIEILRDEYGNGDPEKIHAKLLRRFVDKLGITDKTLLAERPIPEVDNFGKVTLAMWRDGDPIIAFGYHYALELIAMDIHRTFAAGLEGYGFSPEVLEYFRYHSTAEEEHAKMAESGLTRYATDEENREKLFTGVKAGVQALEQMWDGFNRHVFN